MRNGERWHGERDAEGGDTAYTQCASGCGKVIAGHMTDTGTIVHMTGSASRGERALWRHRRWSGADHGAPHERSISVVIHIQLWITLWIHTSADVEAIVDGRVDRCVCPRDQGAS